MRTRRLLAATSATLAAALAVALAGCGRDGTGQPSDVVTVSSNQCGSTWHLAGPGWHTFEISNQSTGGGEIDLIDPAKSNA
jgi:predicted small lipoprotein YifL